MSDTSIRTEVRAAVEEKITAGVAVRADWIAVGEILLDEVRYSNASEYEAVRQQIRALFHDLQTLPPGTYWCPETDTWQWPVPLGPVGVGIDAGGNDDKVAVAVVQPAQPVVA